MILQRPDTHVWQPGSDILSRFSPPQQLSCTGRYTGGVGGVFAGESLRKRYSSKREYMKEALDSSIVRRKQDSPRHCVVVQIMQGNELQMQAPPQLAAYRRVR